MFNISLKSFDKNRSLHDHALMHADDGQPPSKGKMVPVSSLQNLLGRIMKIQGGDRDLTALEK